MKASTWIYLNNFLLERFCFLWVTEGRWGVVFPSLSCKVITNRSRGKDLGEFVICLPRHRYSKLCGDSHWFLGLACFGQYDFYHIAVKSTRVEILWEFHPNSNLCSIFTVIQYIMEVLKCDSDLWRPNARFLEKTSNIVFNFLELWS